MEARVFPENCGGASDRLPAHRIPGSKIPRKTGSQKAWQGESLNSSWRGSFLTLPKTQNQGEKLRAKAQVSLVKLFCCGRKTGTCKSAFRHDKVRRLCYC
jgi:hypothetical protein